MMPYCADPLFLKHLHANELARLRYLPKLVRMEILAAEMRRRYLNTGRGCKTRAKAIWARTQNPENVVQCGR